jgi:nicotinamidase/pyrazinamidase
MTDKFLYVVDMQRDFMPFEGSALPVPGGDVTIKPINDLLAEIKTLGFNFVVVSEDAHTSTFVERMPDGTPFPPHCVIGTPGQQTIVDLNSIPEDVNVFLIRKNAFNVFEEPTLQVFNLRTNQSIGLTRDEFFDSLLEQGVTEVTLTGVCSDICVKDAGLGLLDRGFNVTVPRNCVKGLFREIDDVNTTDWNNRAVLV